MRACYGRSDPPTACGMDQDCYPTAPCRIDRQRPLTQLRRTMDALAPRTRMSCASHRHLQPETGQTVCRSNHERRQPACPPWWQHWHHVNLRKRTRRQPRCRRLLLHKKIISWAYHRSKLLAAASTLGCCCPSAAGSSSSLVRRAGSTAAALTNAHKDEVHARVPAHICSRPSFTFPAHISSRPSFTTARLTPPHPVSPSPRVAVWLR